MMLAAGGTVGFACHCSVSSGSTGDSGERVESLFTEQMGMKTCCTSSQIGVSTGSPSHQGAAAGMGTPEARP